MDWDRERPLSPESTVTTLMSCSGHLPLTHHTIRCGDQDFATASAALDAYIADFERWRLAPGGMARSTGPRLDLQPPGTPSYQPGLPGTLRNRDVLQELLTDTELRFLSLPAASSLHRRADGDEGALTTEELLAIPSDGSLPVTKTTAYLTDLHYRSLCRCSNSPHPLSGLSCRSCGQLGGARGQNPAPSPTTLRWREDMDRKCLRSQEVNRLQNSQTAGSVIGADRLSSSHLSGSSQFRGSTYYCRGTQAPGPAHSVKSSHLQSQSHNLRSHPSLNTVGHTQFGHAHQQKPMDEQEMAGRPSGFWEKAGSIPPYAPSWLDQLPGEEEEQQDQLPGGEDEQQEEEELLSVSLLTDDAPAVSQEPVSKHQLLLANTGHAPIGYTHTGHTPRMLIN